MSPSIVSISGKGNGMKPNKKVEGEIRQHESYTYNDQRAYQQKFARPATEEHMTRSHDERDDQFR